MKSAYLTIILFYILFNFINAHLPHNSSVSKAEIKHGNATLSQLISKTTTLPPPTTTPEPILPEWGGNCTKKDWDKCSHLKLWNTTYLINIKKPELGVKKLTTNCTAEPSLCLRNGWTVTKCQLLCMRCNREILSKYEKFVSHEGKCNYNLRTKVNVKTTRRPK